MVTSWNKKKCVRNYPCIYTFQEIINLKIEENKYPKLPKAVVMIETFCLTVKKNRLFRPKTPNLYKLQNLIKLLNLTKVNEYSLGTECYHLSVIWEICIFVKGIAISIPQRFYCLSTLFIPPKELITLNKPALQIKMSNSI